jgi:putative ABC transport system permease protein
MARIVWAQIRGRPGRSTALLLAVAVAVTGFTVLTGATRTSRLAVTGTVSASARAAYDLLVRPAGAPDLIERSRSLVRPDQLGGQYGGITLAQWSTVQALPGVAVAAPVAMIGYVAATAQVSVDVTAALDPSLTEQVIRLRPTWSGDAGLTHATEPEPRFVYVTRNTVAVAMPSREGLQAPDGVLVPAASLLAAGCDWREIPYTYLERVSPHVWRPICGTWFLENPNHARFSVLNQAQFFVFQQLPGGGFLDFTRVGAAPDPEAGTTTEPVAVARVVFRQPWPLWLGLAAVDPVQEARLVGLAHAVVSGHYFWPPAPAGTGPLQAPVLVTARCPVDEQLTVTAERLDGAAVPGTGPRRLLELLSRAPGGPTGAGGSRADPVAARFGSAQVYATALSDPATSVRLDISISAHAPTYSETGAPGRGGPLVPRTVPVDPSAWATPVSSFGELATGASASEPYLATDVGFRALGRSQIAPLTDVTLRPTLARIGVFDPARITHFSALSAVPLETYAAPTTAGADPRSRALLRDRPLLPTDDPAGYLASPPAALMTLTDARQLTGRSDLISAIRVRVAGVSGVDPVSRERVRLVAEQIVAQTGLAVDVTVGSSPRQLTVQLSAGRYGRPALALSEPWTEKGVATSIIDAVDRKSLVLFGMVLVVCLLFLSNSTAATVRERRRELALLSCLGWQPWRRAALVLAEVAVLGAAAGTLAALASGPLAHVLGISDTSAHGWLAMPVAVGTALLAGMAPAVQAGRTHPAAALHPGTLPVGRVSRRPYRGRPPSLARLGAGNLFRTPGRTLTAVAALATAVSALTLLAAVLWDFDGTVVGTLLGDVVSLRARQVDVVSIAATVVLALVCVADVLYLGVRDRAAELALLRAIGWTEADLARLVLVEGAWLSAIGSLLGATVGLAAMARLSIGFRAGLIGTAALVVAGAFVSTVGATVVPAVLLGLRSTAGLLAEE